MWRVMMFGILWGCGADGTSGKSSDSADTGEGGACTDLIDEDGFSARFTPAFCGWAATCGFAFSDEDECTSYYNDNLDHWSGCFDEGGLTTCLDTIVGTGGTCDEDGVNAVVTACECNCGG